MEKKINNIESNKGYQDIKDIKVKPVVDKNGSNEDNKSDSSVKRAPKIVGIADDSKKELEEKLKADKQRTKLRKQYEKDTVDMRNNYIKIYNKFVNVFNASTYPYIWCRINEILKFDNKQDFLQAIKAVDDIINSKNDSISHFSKHANDQERKEYSSKKEYEMRKADKNNKQLYSGSIFKYGEYGSSDSFDHISRKEELLNLLIIKKDYLSELKEDGVPKFDIIKDSILDKEFNKQYSNYSALSSKNNFSVGGEYQLSNLLDSIKQQLDSHKLSESNIIKYKKIFEEEANGLQKKINELEKTSLKIDNESDYTLSDVDKQRSFKNKEKYANYTDKYYDGFNGKIGVYEAYNILKDIIQVCNLNTNILKYCFTIQTKAIEGCKNVITKVEDLLNSYNEAANRNFFKDNPEDENE